MIQGRHSVPRISHKGESEILATRISAKDFVAPGGPCLEIIIETSQRFVIRNGHPVLSISPDRREAPLDTSSSIFGNMDKDKLVVRIYDHQSPSH